MSGPHCGSSNTRHASKCCRIGIIQAASAWAQLQAGHAHARRAAGTRPASTERRSASPDMEALVSKPLQTSEPEARRPMLRYIPTHVALRWDDPEYVAAWTHLVLELRAAGLLEHGEAR